jgi:hypothetical protein
MHALPELRQLTKLQLALIPRRDDSARAWQQLGFALTPLTALRSLELCTINGSLPLEDSDDPDSKDQTDAYAATG